MLIALLAVLTGRSPRRTRGRARTTDTRRAPAVPLAFGLGRAGGHDPRQVERVGGEAFLAGAFDDDQVAAFGHETIVAGGHGTACGPARRSGRVDGDEVVD